MQIKLSFRNWQHTYVPLGTDFAEDLLLSCYQYYHYPQNAVLPSQSQAFGEFGDGKSTIGDQSSWCSSFEETPGS